MGSCKSLLCDQEVRTIRSWDIFITVAHIPGVLIVDQESRKWNKEQNGSDVNQKY